MKNLSDVKTQNSNNYGLALPLIGLAGLGVVTYFVYDSFDKKRSQEEIDKANAKALAHTLNLQKTNLRIADIEAKAIVNGKNTLGKIVTVNITTQAKKLIDDFFIKQTDKYGIDKYIPRAIKNVNEQSVLNIVYQTPVNSLAKLNKLFSIYTGKSFADSYIKLTPATREKIKAVYSVAYKFYPQTFK